MFNILCTHNSMCCTQVNTSLPQDPYFSPCRAAPRSLWFRHSVLFNRWVECSTRLELESGIVAQNRMLSRNCLYSKPPWLMRPLFSSPFSFSPAAAVHHEQDPGLARHYHSSSSSSSFVFHLLLSPLLLGVSSDTEIKKKKKNPSLSVWDVHRHNTSTWQN